jgi:hypothetical protein
MRQDEAVIKRRLYDDTFAGNVRPLKRREIVFVAACVMSLVSLGVTLGIAVDRWMVKDDLMSNQPEQVRVYAESFRKQME